MADREREKREGEKKQKNIKVVFSRLNTKKYLALHWTREAFVGVGVYALAINYLLRSISVFFFVCLKSTRIER